MGGYSTLQYQDGFNDWKERSIDEVYAKWCEDTVKLRGTNKSQVWMTGAKIVTSIKEYVKDHNHEG